MTTTNIISNCVGICAFALAASCGAEDGSQGIDVTDANALGVTTLQTSRVVDHGNQVWTLQAFSASDQPLASVRLTIGVIPDLSQLLPGQDDFGSEIVVSVAGSDERIVSRETQRFQILARSPSIREFLGLAAVSSALEQEVNVFVLDNGSTVVTAAEDPYQVSAVACAPGDLLTTPVAQQCCYSPYQTIGMQNYLAHTMFVRGSDHSVIDRRQNPHKTGCKAADGVGTCNGGGCFYGPQGYARPSVYSGTASTSIFPVLDSLAAGGGGANLTKLAGCGDGATGSRHFPDVTGTNPTGQGCPGSDGGGGNGAWSY